MTSPKALYDYFEHNGELHPSIIIDLFGYSNWSILMKENRDDTLTMFLGLYKGLYNFDVSHKEIYRCFLKNKLDDLIHTKYSINKSSYYREFCEKKIIIGNTFMTEEENKKTNEEPFIYSQIQPPYHYNRSNTQITEKSLGDEDDIILHKINKYKYQDNTSYRKITDEEYISVNDVKKLLFIQETKCYICADNVITENWQPNCLYQFTLDRIDNKLPHNKNNVLICCYHCNCFNDNTIYADDSDVCLYKLCKDKCHTIKRNITRKRCDVSKEEITKLLLK
jgi:hypothetical protein